MTDTTEITAAPTGAGDAGSRTGSLTALRLPQLQALASELGLSGTAKMRKSDLVDAIKARQGGGSSRRATSGGSASPASNGSTGSTEPAAPAEVAATAPAATDRAERTERTAGTERTTGAETRDRARRPHRPPERADGRPSTQGDPAGRRPG